MELPQRLVIAHRAGNDPALARAAADAGADFVEADVWCYRGRLEVRHEKTVRGLPVLWDKWKLETGLAPRTSLDALLTAIDPDIGLMLDLKGRDERLPSMVARALQDAHRRAPVAVCSQNWH